MLSRFSFENYNKDEIKNLYDEFYKNRDFKRYSVSEKYFIKSLISNYDIQTGSKILDLGCGTGKYTNLFSEYGMNAVGIDISKTGIVLAKKRFPNLQFFVGDVENLGFAAESFNVIFCSGLSLFNETNLDNLLPFVSYLLSFITKNGLFIFVKTTRLTNKFSKNKTRLDYSLESYISFFKKLKNIVMVSATATYPQVFPLIGKLGFSSFITKVSTLNTKLTGVSLRVSIVLRKNI